MKQKRITKKKTGRPRTAAQIPLDFPVNLIAIPERSIEFRLRKDEVQNMIADMFLRVSLRSTEKKKSIKSK